MFDKDKIIRKNPLVVKRKQKEKIAKSILAFNQA